MRNIGRRRIRSSVPNSVYWIEVDSMASNYLIPKWKTREVSKKESEAVTDELVRIRFEDNSVLVTRETNVDFSQKQGKKRIEYFSKELNHQVLSEVNYKITDISAVESVSSIMNQKIKNLKIDNSQSFRYSTTITSNIVSEKNANIKKLTFQGGEIDLNSLKTTTYLQALLSYSGTKLFNIDFSRYQNLNTLLLQFTDLDIENLDLSNNLKLKSIYVGFSSTIKSISFAQIDYSSIKLISLNLNENTYNLKSTAVLDLNRANNLRVNILDKQKLKRAYLDSSVSNRGSELMDFYEFKNLEEVSLIYNSTMLLKYKDFTNFPLLKSIALTGSSNYDESVFVLPIWLNSLSMNEAVNKVKKINIPNGIDKLELNNLQENNGRIDFGTLGALKEIIIKGISFSEKELKELFTKILNNSIPKGKMHIDGMIPKDTSYSNISQEMKEVLQIISQIKSKGWEVKGQKEVINNI